MSKPQPTAPSRVSWVVRDARFDLPTYHGHPRALLAAVDEAALALRAAAEAYRTALHSLPRDVWEWPGVWVSAVPVDELPSSDDLRTVLEGANPVDRLHEVIAHAALADEVRVVDLVERLTDAYAQRLQPHVDYHTAKAARSTR